jgi:hypothetical protein
METTERTTVSIDKKLAKQAKAKAAIMGLTVKQYVEKALTDRMELDGDKVLIAQMRHDDSTCIHMDNGEYILTNEILDKREVLTKEDVKRLRKNVRDWAFFK